MKKLIKYILPAMLLVGCSKVPSDIIQPEEMAELMADFHTGEAVVDMHRSTYNTDSLKMVVKQSIYLRHGVTSAEVDSSLSWYGRNISKYMDVYDRVIEILEQRSIEIGSRVAAEMAMSIAGDSVDVWVGPRFTRINDLMPSKTMVFNMSRDPNWERGDQYTWRTKLNNNTERGYWQIVTEYANGTIEFLRRPIEGDGWKDINFICDSTLDATRIYGFITLDNTPGTSIAVDSVELVRKRLDKNRYNRRFGQRRIVEVLPKVKIEERADSVDNDSTVTR